MEVKAMRILRHFCFLLALCLATIVALLGWTSDASAYDTKSNRENRVRVNVRPVNLVPGEAARFEVRMDTHSVNLIQDMVSVSICRDDQGREYQPVSWQGSPSGGHHRRGILEFPALEGNPNGITLVIKNIANVPERIFEWKLE
jgi:hypothetical protein